MAEFLSSAHASSEVHESEKCLKNIEVNLPHIVAKNCVISEGSSVIEYKWKTSND